MTKVCIFLADGFEEVEALTVVDLLRRAKIDVTTVSITGKTEVTGRSQIRIFADTLFENMYFEDADMLVLPGGMPGTTTLESYLPLCNLLMDHAAKGKYIAAICAAPSILGKLHLLEGKKATSYPGFKEVMTGCEYLTSPTVVDGNMITSRGLGTAIDFASQIITVLKDKETADTIKAEIMY